MRICVRLPGCAGVLGSRGVYRERAGRSMAQGGEGVVWSPGPGGRGGGGGAGEGALLSGALILAGFWHKHWQFIFIEKGANYRFSDPNPPADSTNGVCIFFVFGPHVGPIQTVCPRNGLTEEPHPNGGGGGRLEERAHTTPPPVGAMFHPPIRTG